VPGGLARFPQPSAALADANAGTVACGLRDRLVAASHAPPEQHSQTSDGPPPVRHLNRERHERLADLLPHADKDKDVLAGYLRRAGQDILAIGKYLEDEKNGSVRRD